MNNVNELRLLPKGTKIWSIINQTNFILEQDEILLITNNINFSSFVFGKPQQIHGCILIGIDERLIDKGNDEWSFDYLKTKDYKPNLKKGILPYLEIIDNKQNKTT